MDGVSSATTGATVQASSAAGVVDNNNKNAQQRQQPPPPNKPGVDEDAQQREGPDRTSNADSISTGGNNTTNGGVEDAPAQSSSSSLSISKEDYAIFGSLNANLADAVGDSVSAALAQGVKSLPTLGSEDDEDDDGLGSPNGAKNGGGPAALLKLLQSKYYDRNIDLLELYGARNIFTVGMYPPKRRQEIVEAYHNPDGLVVAAAADNDGCDAEMDTTADGDDKITFPSSMEEIPTPDQIADLERQTKELRVRLQEAKKRRAAAKRQLEQLKTARQVSGDLFSKVVDAAVVTADADTKKIQHAVQSTVVSGMEGLRQWQAHGQELVQKMEDAKRKKQKKSDGDDSSESSDAEDVVMTAAAAAVPKRQLTLEERYERDRQNMFGGGPSATTDAAGSADGATSATASAAGTMNKVFAMLSGRNETVAKTNKENNES